MEFVCDSRKPGGKVWWVFACQMWHLQHVGIQLICSWCGEADTSAVQFIPPKFRHLKYVISPLTATADEWLAQNFMSAPTSNIKWEKMKSTSLIPKCFLVYKSGFPLEKEVEFSEILNRPIGLLRAWHIQHSPSHGHLLIQTSSSQPHTFSSGQIVLGPQKWY